MEEDESSHVLSAKIYHYIQEKSKISNSEYQSNYIDNVKELKESPNEEMFNNEQLEMPNDTRIFTGVKISDQAYSEIEAKFVQSIAKEIMLCNENIEDYLEEKYIWAYKRLAIISEPLEINKFSKAIEKIVHHQNIFSQKYLVLKVKNSPMYSWLIPGSEITVYLKENCPKTMGGILNRKGNPKIQNNKKESTIFINGETQLQINIKNNQVLINETETIKPSAMILIEGTKVIENLDRFRVGSTIFDFNLKYKESIELRCTKTNNRQVLHKWGWDDNTKILIGRGKNNSLAFPDDIKMSKQHFTIEFFEENWVIINQGSKNGVWNYLHNKKTMAGNRKSREIEIFESSQISFQNAIFEVISIKTD